MKNWKDLTNTSNYVIRYLFSRNKTKTINNTNKSSSSSSSDLLPIGMVELLLLTSQAYYMSNNKNDSFTSLKLAIMTSEAKLKEYRDMTMSSSSKSSVMDNYSSKSIGSEKESIVDLCEVRIL